MSNPCALSAEFESSSISRAEVNVFSTAASWPGTSFSNIMGRKKCERVVKEEVRVKERGMRRKRGGIEEKERRGVTCHVTRRDGGTK